MGGNYGKGLYNQLMDVMAKLNAMETEHKQDRQEIKSLTAEVTSLRKENHSLRKKVSVLQEETSSLRKKNAGLEKENSVLRTDNERMKRILGNDPSNSSMPPSSEPPWKAPGRSRAIKGTDFPNRKWKKRYAAGCSAIGPWISVIRPGLT